MENRSRRTKNYADNYIDPGPYIARVVNHLDKKFMGALEVTLLKTTVSGDEDSEKNQTVIVRYASPFFGTTPLHNTSPNDGYRYTQQSYGFWAVPPDIGTKVLVMFVEGDRSKGYWFACLPDEYMNFMVPDGRAATTLTTADTPVNLKGAKLPVGEYNKTLEQGEGSDPTLFKKPYNKDFTELLEIQGLLFDEARGTTTTSSRREVPSAVFGVNTPGPLDKRVGSPKGLRGVKNGEAMVPVSRLGGSSFVMDDGDDKYVRATHASDGPPVYLNVEKGEKGGDETIPQNELIRIRTRTGHQILLHNSEDLIYIANSRGTAWIELTSDGKIDIHADDSISIQTEQDINITAERDINMEAGRNVNINASARWSDGQSQRNGIRSGQVTIQSMFDSYINSGRTTNFSGSETLDLHVKREIRLSTDSEMHLFSKGNMYMRTDAAMHQESKHSWYRKSNSNTYDITKGVLYTQVDGPINVTSQADIFESAKGKKHLTAASMLTQSEGTYSLKAGGDAGIDAPNIYLNSGKSTAATPATVGITGNSATPPTVAAPKNKLPTIILPRMYPGADKPVPYESIVPRAPQHEPWTHHENRNPLAFKPEQTDREIPGELPSSDRILTPDTFLKGNGPQKSSIWVPGSGGYGLGNTGGADSFTSGGAGDPNIGTYQPGIDGPLGKITTSKRGLTTMVAEAFREQFQGFIDELEATGYEIYSLAGYVKRKAINSTKWSYHASGAAIDINPDKNGYFSPARTPVPTDMPANTGQIAAKYGLGWGGDWTSANDAMHFSVARSELGTLDIPRNGLVPFPPATDLPNRPSTNPQPDPGRR